MRNARLPTSTENTERTQRLYSVVPEANKGRILEMPDGAVNSGLSLFEKEEFPDFRSLPRFDLEQINA